MKTYDTLKTAYDKFNTTIKQISADRKAKKLELKTKIAALKKEYTDWLMTAKTAKANAVTELNAARKVRTDAITKVKADRAEAKKLIAEKKLARKAAAKKVTKPVVTKAPKNVARKAAAKKVTAKITKPKAVETPIVTEETK